MSFWFLFFGLLSGNIGAVENPRLALWITEPIGVTSGSMCEPSALLSQLRLLPKSPPTLTENDIIEWKPERALWSIDITRFSSDVLHRDLIDHCFVLAIDNQIITSGIVLSSFSARLTNLSTISVYSRKNSLDFQMTSGNHGSNQHAIYVDQLDIVFGKAANLSYQVQRANQSKDLATKIKVSEQWENTIKKFIEQNKITSGMPVTDLIKQLGTPSSTTDNSDGTNYIWYFETPMHVNPIFSALVKDDFLNSFKLDHR